LRCQVINDGARKAEMGDRNMKAIIAGGGIGGMVTGLMLQARGIPFEIYEQSEEVRELGVGINILPNAVAELVGLDLLEALDQSGVRTHELIYTSFRGQEVWRELRGLHAGAPAPQFSIHRGRLLGLLYGAVVTRCGPGSVKTGCRLASFHAEPDGVVASFTDRDGATVAMAKGDVLIGADGIHSTVRSTLIPGEGPPRWNGHMILRGVSLWPGFLTGRSMIIAGGLDLKLVIYPIAEPDPDGQWLTNWAIVAKVGEVGPPPSREDWSRRGELEQALRAARRFGTSEIDPVALIGAADAVWEYPMCDRDPLHRWSFGRVTLLGDAAHPMYPVGSNGGTQAILDARCLADHLAGSDDPTEALARYEADRIPPTAAIVVANRAGGPEGVIDVVERLAPDGFDDIEAILPHDQREGIVRGKVELVQKR
jgi:5-methylphenazine-1-carboxylate 1-monooxygenase